MSSFWKGTFVPFKKYVVSFSYGARAIDDDGNVYVEIDVNFGGATDGRAWGNNGGLGYTYYLLEDFIPEEDRREYLDEAGTVLFDDSIRIIQSIDEVYDKSIIGQSNSILYLWFD